MWNFFDTLDEDRDTKRKKSDPSSNRKNMVRNVIKNILCFNALSMKKNKSHITRECKVPKAKIKYRPKYSTKDYKRKKM